MYSTSFISILIGFAISVAAIPTFDGVTRSSVVGSLVPGISYIEALGPVRDNQRRTQHLALQFPGQPGNLTVIPNTRVPPLFYINRNQLLQYNNETSINYVSAVNTTKTAGFPLQLVVGRKPVGVSGGSWRWQGTMLHYDQGSGGNSGLYYSCTLDNGSNGIFMFLQPSQTPVGCETMTLHSWNRNYMNGYNK